LTVLNVARKTLIEAWRDRQLIAIYLSFPSLMILMYYLAFGQISSMANFLTVLVNDRDQGPLSAEFVQALRAARFDNQPVFTVQEVTDARLAEIALAEGKAALLLTIPPGFSAALSRQDANLSFLELHGDPMTDTYVFARSFLTGIAEDFAARKTGWHIPLPVTYEFLPNTGKISDFQSGVPGVLLFGVMFGIITSALMLVRESSSGTLQRIRLSGATGGQILGGVTLANLGLALVQVPASYAVAILFGFQSPGSLFLAVAITLVACLGATGCGFISACFSHTEGSATGIATVFMALLVFVSGAIFPLPPARLFTIAGHAVQAYDILLTTPASEALRRVLIYGDGVSAIAYELILMSALSLLVLAAGAILYQKRVLD
jgi:ABC-type multidrug transport system permease subunit